MPTLIGLSRTAMRYDRTSAACVAFAEALPSVSHDRLPSLLPADGSGHPRLARACRTRVVVAQGDLRSDDPVIAPPCATALEGGAWVDASQEPRAVYGRSVVRLIWTAGTVRSPRGLRLWHPGGGATDALALAWLSAARHRWRCRPASVLCDAWSPSQTRLTRVRDYGWSWIGRLTTNRRGHPQPLRPSRRPPDGTEAGRLTGGRQVVVVSDGATDCAPTRLSRPAAEVRRRSRIRAHMAAVVRGCLHQRGRKGGHTCLERAQRHHRTGGLVACCVLERERRDQGLTIDHLRRPLSCRGQVRALPALEQPRQAA